MQAESRDIVAVNVASKLVITDDGEQLPITNMFDELGDDCFDDDEAVGVVAGPDKQGFWWSITLEDYIDKVAH